ncbi:MAG: hypothetical protein AAGB29_07370 [Planctomycetota bacterium]
MSAETIAGTPIDPEDAEMPNQVIHEAILAWATVVLAVAGLLFPIRLNFPSARYWSLVPLASLVCFVAYEVSNDPTYSIRVDWFCLIPLLAASIVAMVIRLSIINARNGNPHQESDSEDS